MEMNHTQETVWNLIAIIGKRDYTKESVPDFYLGIASLAMEKTYDKSSQSWWTKQKEKMGLLFKNKGQFFIPALKWNLIENQHISI